MTGKRCWDIIEKALEIEGVKYVFGLPGDPGALCARACDCYGEKVNEAKDIHGALIRAMKKNEEGVPAVLDFVVDSMDHPEGFKEFNSLIF